MHLKNVGFIQRHIEKLLIIVAVASLAGSIWFYLLGTPHKVVIGGVTLPPREIDQELNKQAKTLEAAIASTDVDDDIEQIRDINVVEPYLARSIAHPHL